MKIYYERIGGFAGMRIALDLDLHNLSAEEASTLKSMIQEADFFHLTESLSQKTTADGFQYSITIEERWQKHTIRVDDSSIPENLRPLLDELSMRARSQRRAE